MPKLYVSKGRGLLPDLCCCARWDIPLLPNLPAESSCLGGTYSEHSSSFLSPATIDRKVEAGWTPGEHSVFTGGQGLWEVLQLTP